MAIHISREPVPGLGTLYSLISGVDFLKPARGLEPDRGQRGADRGTGLLLVPVDAHNVRRFGAQTGTSDIAALSVFLALYLNDIQCKCSDTTWSTSCCRCFCRHLEMRCAEQATEHVGPLALAIGLAPR